MAEKERRTALITGGTRGLGRAIAEHLLAAGWTVAVCGRSLPDQPVRAGGGEARAYAVDVRDPEAVDGLIRGVVAQFGRLDLLVNNAGGSPHRNLEDSSSRLIERIVALNLLAPLNLCRAAFPALREQCGSIVNIASVSGRRPSPGTTAYGAAKAGLLSATESLAMEWGSAVRVNAIVVGLVEDPEQTEHYGGDAGVARIAAALPMGRMVRGGDLGPLVEWLASPAAAFVTGAQIALHSGGETPMHMLLSGVKQD